VAQRFSPAHCARPEWAVDLISLDDRSLVLPAFAWYIDPRPERRKAILQEAHG